MPASLTCDYQQGCIFISENYVPRHPEYRLQTQQTHDQNNNTRPYSSLSSFLQIQRPPLARMNIPHHPQTVVPPRRLHHFGGTISRHQHMLLPHHHHLSRLSHPLEAIRLHTHLPSSSHFRYLETSSIATYLRYGAELGEMTYLLKEGSEIRGY